MIYVYAPSMATVVYAMQHWQIDELCIISYNDVIEKFCININLRIIKIEQNHNLSFNGLLGHKKYIRGQAIEIKHAKIYFMYNSHDYWGLWLLKLLNKHNSVCLINFNSIYKSQTFFNTRKICFRLHIDRIILFLVTGIYFNILTFNNTCFFGIKIDRLKRKYKLFENAIDLEITQLNSNIVLNKYNLKEPSIILIEQGEAFYKYNSETIETILLLANSTRGFYLKQHPTVKTKNAVLLNNLNELPVEIPIELLINNSTILIGIASEAIKNHKNTISIINLLELPSNTLSNYKEFLKNNPIIYPKTQKELINLILKW